MGWMESENMMSVVDRAMMNTSVGTSFLRLSISTRMTSRLRMQLTSTEGQDSVILTIQTVYSSSKVPNPMRLFS